MESLVKRQAAHVIIQQDIGHVIQVVGDSLNRLRGKRLLVTGGTGFIGTWLLETVSQINEEWDQPCRVYVPTRNPEGFARKAPHLAARLDITLLPGDVCSFEYPDDACDFIVHAAAPADPLTLLRDPLGVAETIVDGTQRVLELAARKKVASFLFVSSGAVYGIQPPDLERVPEDYAGGSNIASPGSAYGEAKRYAEMLCALYHQNSGVAVRIARPFTFVGPYQDLNAGFAVTDFIRDALQGLPLHIQGDGTTVRSYYYASDLAAALWRILLDGPVGRAYNVGSDEPISILELARKIILILGTPTEIIVGGKPVPGKRPHRYVPDISRGRSELGLPVGTGLEEALRRTLDWTRETHHTL